MPFHDRVTAAIESKIARVMSPKKIGSIGNSVWWAAFSAPSATVVNSAAFTCSLLISDADAVCLRHSAYGFSFS